MTAFLFILSHSLIAYGCYGLGFMRGKETGYEEGVTSMRSGDSAP